MTSPDTQPPGSGGPGEPGSVAEESARLLDALRSRTRGAAAHLDLGAGERSAPSTAGEGHEHPGGQAASCVWCPLCAGARVVRGLRPETAEVLADVLSLGAQGLRDLADVVRGTSAGPAPAAGQAANVDEPAADEHAPDAPMADEPAPDDAPGGPQSRSEHRPSKD